jgi:hypothetical protein
MDSDSIEKIMEIDGHVGCAMSGLTADARTMVEHARVTAQVGLYGSHGVTEVWEGGGGGGIHSREINLGIRSCIARLKWKEDGRDEIQCERSDY